MPKAKQNWSECKKAVKDWPRPGILALLKELYDLSSDNRQFFHARLLVLDEPNSANVIAAAAKTLRSMITPAAYLHDRISFREVIKLIDRFAKANDDPAASAGLWITDVQLLCEAAGEYGDDSPKLVNHFYTAVNRLEKVLERIPPDQLKPLAERLKSLARAWGHAFGYGMGDEVVRLADRWGKKVGLPAIEDSEFRRH